MMVRGRFFLIFCLCLFPSASVAFHPGMDEQEAAGEASVNGNDDSVVRVMNVGDSITLGVDFYSNSVPGGYRIKEAEELKRAHETGRAKNVTFVGPFEGPKGYFHCGYNAAMIEGMARNVYSDVLNSKPNIVTLQAGTNDFFFPSPRGTDAAGALERLKVWVLNAFKAAKDASIDPFHIAISATTTINATKCATYHLAPWKPPDCPDEMPQDISAFSMLLKTYVAETNDEKGFAALSFHDPNAAVNGGKGFLESDYSKWGIHFSNTGYPKLGVLWAKHLAQLDAIKTESTSTPAPSPSSAPSFSPTTTASPTKSKGARIAAPHRAPVSLLAAATLVLLR